ncbi:demethylmenaquinone methyltransferase / 2-methoxy-6-polyprenyl-1,4-benzoquinol methylase [Mytilus galloprovincialis]|uniref:Demethylmenaquinone methyltransferase / 2-methoxy-6-polyprenyl-1,4-benzoquinol methylase n=1 Tax=Mytilus galloprovincialis TaxID=29158 RepID=A0A8B6DPA4_MYTGA|nr:demethylmenaquinone methyltransferase / 2-methoxy-6-polyprenyl-1,4-benzoquinol methylase [Mytilus galloprovincialis]
MAAPMKVRRLLCARKFNTFCRFMHSKQQNESQQKETHFGFQNIPENEKEDKVYEVFKNVASSYDLMNDAMSAGVHRLWKDHFIRRLGDIAFRFLKYIDNLNKNESDDLSVPNHIDGFQLHQEDQDLSSSSSSSSDEEDNHVTHHVTVCDINQEMLDVGRQKAESYGICSGMSWLKGNAECLQLEDNQFDAYTIAFGIRNCTHVDKVVEEAYRVLKPGGRFMCLEFSEVKNPLLRRLVDRQSV